LCSSSVYNRFDKIYVGKLIQDRFRNKEIVSIKPGTNDSADTVEMTGFSIRQEQISLFDE
jgi:hypothetical protein